MGRELKRVALDFDWPLRKQWKGFVNPYYAQCPHCDGRGLTMGRRRLEDLVRLLLLSGSDAATQISHPYFRHPAMVGDTAGKVPSKDLADLTTGLAGRPPAGRMGHDAIDSWTAAKKIIAAAGLDPDTWGRCSECGGDGILPSAREKYQAWEPEEPPEGPGYQLWETVSEGSPVSPVFETPEELARWLSNDDNLHPHDIQRGTSYETWLKFIQGPGHAFSLVTVCGRPMSGVQAAVEDTQED